MRKLIIKDKLTVGQRIKEARKKAGMTQKQLGAKIGISFQAIAQWENNLRNPKPETLKRIAEALDVSPSSLDSRLSTQIKLDFSSPEVITEDVCYTPNNLASDREIENIRVPIDSYMGKLLYCLDNLNEKGQTIALERIEELAKISDYQRSNSL